MEKAKCYLECAKVKTIYSDKNGGFKILNNITQNFQVKILEIFLFEKSENDFQVGFELEHLLTGEIKKTDLKTVTDYYTINHL